MLYGHFKNTKSDSHIHSQCSQHPSCTHFIFISHSDPLLSRCFNARFRLAWGHFSVRLIFSARLSLLMWTYQSFDLFRNSMDERNYPPRYKHNHSGMRRYQICSWKHSEKLSLHIRGYHTWPMSWCALCSYQLLCCYSRDSVSVYHFSFFCLLSVDDFGIGGTGSITHIPYSVRFTLKFFDGNTRKST